MKIVIWQELFFNLTMKCYNTKISNSKKIHKGKSFFSNGLTKSSDTSNEWTPDMVQVFPHVKNDELNLVLNLTKPLTCVTVS